MHRRSNTLNHRYQLRYAAKQRQKHTVGQQQRQRRGDGRRGHCQGGAARGRECREEPSQKRGARSDPEGSHRGEEPREDGGCTGQEGRGPSRIIGRVERLITAVVVVAAPPAAASLCACRRRRCRFPEDPARQNLRKGRKLRPTVACQRERNRDDV